MRTEEGDRALFFENGDPVHAVGAGFSTHYLGQLVAEARHLPTTLVMEALQRHQGLPEADRPPFGELLVTQFNLERADLEACVRQQCSARFSQCFGLPEQTAYQSAPGQSDRIRSLGLKVDGWGVLLNGLTEHGSDFELKETADRLLGRSVKLKGSIQQLDALTPIPEPLRAGLRYLEKPRRPDQLERSLKRRRARGLLRTLELLDILETGAASKAIAIPKVSTRKSTRPAAHADAAVESPAGAPPSADGPRTPSRPRPAPASRISPQLAADVEIFFAKLEEKQSHFELLGVDPKDPPEALRGRYTELVKRFHPDAFVTTNPDPDLEAKVRAISARINEAYTTLASPEARSEYEEMLANDRVKGDAVRQAQLKDAAMKHTKAMVHLKMKEYEKAQALLRSASDIDKHNLTYKAQLAWSQIVDPNQDREHALRSGLSDLEAAAKADREHPDLQYYLGRAYKELGRMEDALKHFKAASRLDPRYKAAHSEVRLLASRLQKKRNSERTDVKSSLLRFFKRKDGDEGQP